MDLTAEQDAGRCITQASLDLEAGSGSEPAALDRFQQIGVIAGGGAVKEQEGRLQNSFWTSTAEGKDRSQSSSTAFSC